LINNEELAAEYIGGICLIFRLTVDDYHRYCYFDNGTKGNNTFIKGVLHTVNPIALGKYNIYKRNSREYTVLETENFGKAVQDEVGALLVGRIKNLHQTHTFKRGEEKGMFEFGGSTVVLLLKNNTAVIDDDIINNTKANIETVVRMGEVIGHKI
jgi:phosphatidylserine decarboxylase